MIINFLSITRSLNSIPSREEFDSEEILKTEIPEEIEFLLPAHDRGQYWGVRGREGQIKGLINYHHDPDNESLVVDMIWVTEEYRKKGMATQMIEDLIDLLDPVSFDIYQPTHEASQKLQERFKKTNSSNNADAPEALIKSFKELLSALQRKTFLSRSRTVTELTLDLLRFQGEKLMIEKLRRIDSPNWSIQEQARNLELLKQNLLDFHLRDLVIQDVPREYKTYPTVFATDLKNRSILMTMDGIQEIFGWSQTEEAKKYVNIMSDMIVKSAEINFELTEPFPIYVESRWGELSGHKLGGDVIMRQVRIGNECVPYDPFIEVARLLKDPKFYYRKGIVAVADHEFLYSSTTTTLEGHPLSTEQELKKLLSLSNKALRERIERMDYEPPYSLDKAKKKDLVYFLVEALRKNEKPFLE